MRGRPKLELYDSVPRGAVDERKLHLRRLLAGDHGLAAVSHPYLKVVRLLRQRELRFCLRRNAGDPCMEHAVAQERQRDAAGVSGQRLDGIRRALDIDRA